LARRILSTVAVAALCVILCACFDLKPDSPLGQPTPVATATPDSASTPPDPAPAKPPAEEPKGTPAGPPPPNFRRVDEAPKVRPFGEVAVVESVAVFPSRAVIGQTPLKDAISGRPGQSADRLLIISIGVANHSDTKKLNYRSWHPEVVTGGDVAILRDEFGNTYKGLRFGVGVEPIGRVKSASVYPGQSIVDVLVFELPIDKAKQLDLELPGENIGVSEVIRFRLDARKLRAGEYEKVKDPKAPGKAKPGEPMPPAPPKPEPVAPVERPKAQAPRERPAEERKAIYTTLTASLARVEAEAIKKFGRKPKADDLAGFTAPYKLFVERETDKVYQALFRDKGVDRFEAEAILEEGTTRGWPKGSGK
jgi:hypothetical protein